MGIYFRNKGEICFGVEGVAKRVADKDTIIVNRGFCSQYRKPDTVAFVNTKETTITKKKINKKLFGCSKLK